LCSFEVVEALEKIYAEEHIPAEAQRQFDLATRYVLFGFLSGDGMMDELRARLPQLDKRIVAAVADKIQSKVLNDYLPETEKIYAPPGEPVRVEEIKKPEGAAPSPPATVKTGGAGPAPMPFAGGPPPKPFSDIALTKPEVPAAPPKPAVPPPPGAPVPAAPTFMQPKVNVQPLSPQKDFRFQFSAASAASKLNASAAQPPKPAQVELGNTGSAVPKPAAAGPAEVKRVVHYSQWKTPLTAPTTSLNAGPAPVSFANLTTGIISPKAIAPGPTPVQPPPPPPPAPPVSAAAPAAPAVKATPGANFQPAGPVPPPSRSVDTVLAKLAPQGPSGLGSVPSSPALSAPLPGPSVAPAPVSAPKPQEPRGSQI